MHISVSDIKLSVKSEEGAETESPKFDLKLLIQPIVYSVRLDDMNVFKSRPVDSIREKNIIDRALIESKPKFPEPKIKKDDENESSNCEDNRQSDVSDSQDEDYVPEEKKVKLSCYLLQKPRCRSYNPIQLCKNPDFNTRLKRLTFGFLSSTRNRTFLKLLKPMTIDLSKNFEEKLINGTMYLKCGECPVVKTENTADEPTEQASAVLPSAMPVQSLIDNTPLNIREILKPMVQATARQEDHKLTERQKTIHLPDINHIRRINQQLLTAEVTPMRMNINNNRYMPPVQLVSPPNEAQVNVKTEIKNNVGDNTFTKAVHGPGVVQKQPDIVHRDAVQKTKLDESLRVREKPPLDASVYSRIQEVPGPSSATTVKEVTNTVKSKINSLTEKYPCYRVKPNRSYYSLPWNTAKKVSKCAIEDSLLTVDTLQRMLMIVNDGPNDTMNKTKTTKKSKNKAMSTNELQKRLAEYETSLRNQDKPPDIEPEQKSVNNEKTDTKTDATEKDEKVTKKVVPRLKIIKDKPYAPFCCWARLKMESKKGANYKKHQCPRLCRCCCRDELALKMTTELQKRHKPAEILISDDEDGRSINDTIENVIKQSKDVIQKAFIGNNPATTNTAEPINQDFQKEKTEVSIQCELGPQKIDSRTGLMETAPLLKKNETSPGNKSFLRVKLRNKPINKGKPISEEIVTIDDADDNYSAPPMRAPQLGHNSRHPQSYITTQKTMKNADIPILSKVQGHIIIDGTKNLTVHKKPITTYVKTKKLLYLNNNIKTKPRTSPIYLGKNKILLTDVKFPTATSNAESSNVEKHNRNRISSAVLPAGVQFVLLPNGLVSYTVETGVQLDDAQKNAVSVVMAAVQEQINASGATPMDSARVLSSTAVNPNTDHVVTNDNAEIINLVDITHQTNDESTPEIIEKVQEVAAMDTPPVNENADDENIQTTDKTDSSSEQQICNEKQQDENTACKVEIETAQNIFADADVTQESTEKNITNNKNAIPSTDLLNKEVLLQPNTEPVHNTADDMSKDVSENLKIIDKVDKVDKADCAATQVNNEFPKDSPADNTKKKEVENLSESSGVVSNANRKSLLSDLMEMSGIWDDIDTNIPAVNENTNLGPAVAPAIAPTEVIPASEPAIELAPVVALPTEVVPEGAEPTGPSTLAVSQQSLSDLGSFTLPPLAPIVNSAPELTPIISFEQLKYACEMNGHFFKLDLDTGTLSGISVCIKKKPNEITKAVIDLTEDEREQIDNEMNVAQVDYEPPEILRHLKPDQYLLPSHLQRSLLKISGPPKRAGVADPVKPIKLFRSVRIIKRNKEHTILLPAEAEMAAHSQKKHARKQALVDVRVEENEDSLDSSSLDQYIYRDSDFLCDSSDDNSSDDEPLAIKAKRMRTADAVNNKVFDSATNIIEKNVSVVENTEISAKDQTITSKRSDHETQNDNTENLAEVDEGDNYVVETSEPEMDENLMAFMPDNIEEGDEDCILGF